jgi:hypothetical protein
MLFLAEVLQNSDQENSDRVPPKIRRNESHAEPAMTITNVLMRRDGAAKGCCVPAIILGMRFGQRCRSYTRAIL